MVFPSPFYRWRPHPWHGLEVGPQPPRLVTAYIELTPFDLVKYEVDKTTGYLKVDRPQHTSSQPPTLYGFIPRTYCGARVGALASKAIKGDGDPLDICVIKSEVILTARVVGGMLMIDNGEADDKILAVLDKDRFWEKAQDVADLPSVLVERLRHYFSTYKLIPGKESAAYIESIYDAAHAMQVIEAARQDYTEMFGE